MKKCPIHGKPGLLVFMCCRGAAGGQSVSRKKIKAVKENLQRAIRARDRRTP